MKIVLFYLLVVVGGLAYYEYTWQEQSAAGFSAQENAWQDKVNALETSTTDLKQKIKTAERQIDLFNAARAPEANPSEMTAASHGVTLPQAIPLGTLTTTVCKTYHNTQVLKVGTDDITISSDEGITQVPFAFLMPDLQKRFGYDPQKVDALKQAQIRYEEQLREAGASGAGQ